MDAELEDLLIDTIISPTGRRRYTQDTSVMTDVWLKYANVVQDYEVSNRIELILTPWYHSRPSDLVTYFHEATGQAERRATSDSLETGQLLEDPFSLLQNASDVLGEFSYGDFVTYVLPRTAWWSNLFPAGDNYMGRVSNALSSIRTDFAARVSEMQKAQEERQLFALQLVGLIGLLTSLDENSEVDEEQIKVFLRLTQNPGRLSDGKNQDFLEVAAAVSLKTEALIMAMSEHLTSQFDETKIMELPRIWTVSLNRPASFQTFQSRKTVKADASERVFEVDTSTITWAVIDSGIDAEHPAFRDPEDPSRCRVIRSYDFTKLRGYLAGAGPVGAAIDPSRIAAVQTAQRAVNRGRPVDWDTIEELVRVRSTDIQQYTQGIHPHGTHVAGILGGFLPGTHPIVQSDTNVPRGEAVAGVCPKIRLIDIRVFDEDGRGDEFTIMAALQFIRHLNRNRDKPMVHGVNLSLSLEHKVINFACGQTPICLECERLIGAGTVVVAAAGNNGHHSLNIGGGRVDAYLPISITDPGNAEGVITVGATHRGRPHEYGVSYFSSRGPTGDGRYKPDLLAPGEKITAPIVGQKLDRLDGTSMAAPHVSGAAAMLMARHRELIGKPERIKQVLCDTATDLNRDRYFQGAGLLDVLRALQSL